MQIFANERSKNERRKKFMNGWTDQELGFLGLLTGTTLIVIAVFSVIYYILTAVGLGKMFKKAGEPAWKGWVPIFNMYILFKTCWKTNIFYVWLAFDLVGFVLNKLSGDNLILSLIAIAFSIACMVIFALCCGHIAKAYGKGTGTAVGFFFLSVIFSWIIGAGKAQYIGPVED